MVWIAGQTVGAGGTSGFTFSSIPQTFTHLQVRVFARGTGTSGAPNNFYLTSFNGTSANGSVHRLLGDGSAAGSNSYTGGSSLAYGYTNITSQTANVFGSYIIDILDYANTNKNKVYRSIGGFDVNGSGGYVSLNSGLVVGLGTAAITSFILNADVGYDQYSRADLYGITTSQVTGA
jgi:hypothetical protein